MRKITRREMLRLVAFSSAGAVLAACAPTVTATPAPPSTPLPVPATYTPMPQATATTAAAAPTAMPATAAAPTNTAAAQALTNAWGVAMPADAAPIAEQFLRFMSVDGTTMDFAVGVYKRPGNTDILTTPLVRLNKNFEILPAGALSWEVSQDGKTWTFHLDPAITWSDGSP